MTETRATTDMPLLSVWVRHGMSEHNLYVRAEKEGWVDQLPEELRTRPDWEHPLTPLGHRQAAMAHDWLAENVGDPDTFFDTYLTSPAIRSRQTAGHIAPKAKWRKHDALMEQDWGEFGITPYSERSERFPRTTRGRQQAKWYTRLDGGESPQDHYFRLRDLRDTLRIKYAGQKVLLVAHGGTQMAARYLTENMLPEEYHAVEEDKAQDLGNCALILYSRQNPEDKTDISPYIRWRRMIQPDNLDRSPFGGEWCELPGRREFTGQQLLQQAEQFPPLISPERYQTLPN